VKRKRKIFQSPEDRAAWEARVEARLRELRAHIAQRGWGAEVEMVPGGQRFEHLLVAVE